ncbi:MAG: Dam family site-specific DNA-(adenine-N6)-methyltransferase [Dehalococcoidia bacterium]
MSASKNGRRPAPAHPAGRDERLSPPLKWAGGKRWLVPHLKPLWQAHGRRRRLVEPFCGGLAVALGLQPERALLNDINAYIINFYSWLKQGLRPTIVDMANSHDAYYANRERFNELVSQKRIHSREAALLFYYLNRTGYNGLCRFNRRGEFNVPFGRYKQINYATNFSDYRQAFDGWTFSVGSFEDVSLEKNDFVYADPPYDVEFTQYAKEGFGWEDQVRLAKWLTRHPGPVVLSNQATRRILRLYKELGYSIFLRQLAPRRISCNGDRTPALEVVATRNI